MASFEETLTALESGELTDAEEKRLLEDAIQNKRAELGLTPDGKLSDFDRVGMAQDLADEWEAYDGDLSHVEWLTKELLYSQETVINLEYERARLHRILNQHNIDCSV